MAFAETRPARAKTEGYGPEEAIDDIGKYLLKNAECVNGIIPFLIARAELFLTPEPSHNPFWRRPHAWE